MIGWQLWLVAAVVLFVAEMFAPAGFFLACAAIGALLAAVIASLPFGLTAQVLGFAAGTLLSAMAVRPFLLRHFHLRGGGVRTNVDALIGKIGIVTERIDPITGKGRLLVDGEDWRGASIDGAPVESGTRVTVIQVDGTTLKVDREG